MPRPWETQIEWELATSHCGGIKPAYYLSKFLVSGKRQALIDPQISFPPAPNCSLSSAELQSIIASIYSTMITRFLTDVRAKFNPFSSRSKTARLFLAILPPNARSSMKIETQILSRHSKEPAVLFIKLSTSQPLDPA